ncbi:FecR family protein [Asticcacaulis sp. 201]|uniref:FecR family protein n=1 Tax=Asticcacaulis sp. 201 TaxID=3028787 RepID=UPI002915D30C|nr:FecR domain-containing protein [Asticcacaulis sp. 201]MDV6331180.1 FecR domain-containing protein [Asticcacaulis sp. 201]
MTSPDPTSPEGLTEQEQLFLASLTRPLSADESERLKDGDAAKNAELTATWLAMAAFADTADIQALRREALAAGKQTQQKRPGFRALGLAAAACLALAIGAGGLILWSASRLQTYTAPDRGIGHVTLADGTEVTLSAGGQIRSRISRSARDIELVRGDAYFAVRHDAGRTLTVTSGNHRAIDLGTEFNISQTDTLYRLTLVSGALRVENTRSGYRRDLVPGQSYLDQGGTEHIALETSQNAARWAKGQLAFDDASLAEVDAAFSRLTGRRILFSTPALAKLRLSGTISLEKPDRASQAISAALPVNATPTPAGDIRVSAR